ncbi:MAG: hypothetical protein HQK54_16465, partial [Oligoflexales bacterium]|nr:hypothetical protein [Oligoflexales bacterium]
AWDYQVGAGRFYMHIIPAIYFVFAFGIDLINRIIRLIPLGSTKGNLAGKAKLIIRDNFIYLAAIAFLYVPYDMFYKGQNFYAAHKTVADTINRVHRNIAEYLIRNAASMDVVITQDMGFIPYFAKNLIFIDTIGICDRNVAKELFDTGYNYYIRHLMYRDPALVKKIDDMDGRIRNYLKSYNAKWIIYFAYLPGNKGKEAEASAASIALGNYDKFFDPYLGDNNYFHGLFKDPEVMSQYEPVKAWMWNYQAYYVLFKRKT